MILLLVSRLYSTPLPQAAGRQLTDRVGTRHGNFTPPRIAPSCPHCVVPVSPGAVAGQEYHDGWRGSDQGSFGSPGRNAKQPATGCFVDGWVPLRTLCAALIGAAVEGRDFPSRLSPYRWSWRILQRRFSPPPGGLSPANVSRCRIFTCQAAQGIVPSLYLLHGFAFKTKHLTKIFLAAYSCCEDLRNL